MLLVLTGDIQIGKTSWLLASAARLEEAGVAVEGIVAPGVWRPVHEGDPAFAEASAGLPDGAATPVGLPDGSAAGDGGPDVGVRYEKLGIDNVLLPGRERVAFAWREDLARAEGTYDAASQAARAGLVWHIDDGALAQVNAHFDVLAARVGAPGEEGRRRLLVVDELGRLELMRGEGLTSAMALLAAGPQGWYDHALVIARDMFGLADRVAELYGEAWGGAVRIAPGEEAWTRWLAPLANGANG